MKKVTIITPTYNRANLIDKLYFSLLNQTNNAFVWLVVDDGSNDETKSIIEKFKQEKKIKIEYFRKPNGGKHTALNFAFKKLVTPLSVILDSDDIFTEDAVETIIKYAEKYKSRKNLCGFVFLKGYDQNNSVTKKFPDDEIIANYNDYIINSGIKGDKCEVFYSNVLSKYYFDEYQNEKFLAEGYLWSIISEKYDMVFVNKIIYLCDYLDGGLTKSGRTLRIKNPRGGMRHAKQYLKPIYVLKIRLKNALLYLTYSRFAKERPDFDNSKFLLLVMYIPSMILYFYWKSKYLNGER